MSRSFHSSSGKPGDSKCTPSYNHFVCVSPQVKSCHDMPISNAEPVKLSMWLTADKNCHIGYMPPPAQKSRSLQLEPFSQLWTCWNLWTTTEQGRLALVLVSWKAIADAAAAQTEAAVAFAVAGVIPPPGDVMSEVWHQPCGINGFTHHGQNL